MSCRGLPAELAAKMVVKVVISTPCSTHCINTHTFFSFLTDIEHLWCFRNA